jgi:hypothetical protein
MRGLEGGLLAEVLRDWLGGKTPEERESIGRRTAEFMLSKALEGHFGFFKLVIELVDSRVETTREDIAIVADGCTVTLPDEGPNSEVVRAA